MKSRYHVILVFNKEKEIIDELENFLKGEISRRFTKEFKGDLIRFHYNRYDKNSIDGPLIAVVIGDDGGYDIARNQDLINDLIKSGVYIVPVFKQDASFQKVFSEQFHSINGFIWDKNSPEKKLGRKILEFLGLSEKERQIFISYRRSDGINIASQIFLELRKRRFNAFLDIYDIDYGENFEDYINRNIDDKSFLLVIESPDAHNSSWVAKEVQYASKHNIGLLKIQWPGKTEEIDQTQDFPSLKLKRRDFEIFSGYKQLKRHSLNKVIDEIETWHADGLWRRRQNLILSIYANAQRYYKRVEYLANWKLLLKERIDGSKKQNILLGITPRIPTPKDLYELDQDKTIIDEDLYRVLVHPIESLVEDCRNLIKWITEKRKISCESDYSLEGNVFNG